MTIERLIGIGPDLVRYYAGLNEDKVAYVRALLPNGERREVTGFEMSVHIDHPPRFRVTLGKPDNRED